MRFMRLIAAAAACGAGTLGGCASDAPSATNGASPATAAESNADGPDRTETAQARNRTEGPDSAPPGQATSEAPAGAGDPSADEPREAADADADDGQDEPAASGDEGPPGWWRDAEAADGHRLLAVKGEGESIRASRVRAVEAGRARAAEVLEIEAAEARVERASVRATGPDRFTTYLLVGAAPEARQRADASEGDDSDER